jgi:hypothetical protein
MPALKCMFVFVLRFTIHALIIFVQIRSELLTEAASTALLLLSEPLLSQIQYTYCYWLTLVATLLIGA